MDNWYEYSWEEKQLVQKIIDGWLAKQHYQEPKHFTVSYRNTTNPWWLSATRGVFNDISYALKTGKDFAKNNPNYLVKVGKGDIVIALYTEGNLVYFNLNAYERFTIP